MEKAHYTIVGLSLEALNAISELLDVPTRSFTVTGKGRGKKKVLTIKPMPGVSTERPFYVIDVKVKEKENGKK